jgi:hypothetical protein
MTTIDELLGLDEHPGRDRVTSRLRRLIDALPDGVVGSTIAPQVSAALGDLLQVPIDAIAWTAWERYQRVADACARTAGRSGVRETVALHDPTISNTRHISVELDVAGARRQLFDVTLLLAIQVTTVEVVVEAGRVVWARPGAAQASVALLAGDHELLRRAARPVALHRPLPPPAAAAA